MVMASESANWLYNKIREFIFNKKNGFWQMRFNQNIGLIIYPCPVYLLIVPQPSSFPSQPKPSHSFFTAFIHSTHLSRPVEKLKLSKGLGDVQKRRNMHATSVVGRDIASDLSSGWHYHHQRSDIRDNFFLAAEGLNLPWHRNTFFQGASGSQWIVNFI